MLIRNLLPDFVRRIFLEMKDYGLSCFDVVVFVFKFVGLGENEMNPPRIELGYPRCKRGVLPLDYGFLVLRRRFLFLKLVI